VQMYKGEANWELIGEIKRNPRVYIPIFGNGDIDSPEKALAYKNQYNVDGIMIGRASIGYPWIFNEIKHFIKTGEKLEGPTLQQRVEVCKKHLLRSIQWKGPKVGIFEMRRHYTNYFKGMPNFKPYRARLVEAPDYNAVIEILDEVQYNFQYSEVV
jgi:tRNA-dihydrouridine synthase B